MFEDMYEPKLSKKAKLKIKKFQALKSENGFSVALGALLLAGSKRYLTLDELHSRFVKYLHKFANKYYILPILGYSFEDTIDNFVKYGGMLQKTINNSRSYNITVKYKTSDRGLIHMKTCIQDKEIFDLLKEKNEKWYRKR